MLPRTTCRSAAELLQAFAEDAQRAWFDEFVEYLTVGETYFLRDAAQVTALRETILPDIITRRASERRLRLWSAGCSTGEEPYTLAMLLQEQTVLGSWDVLLVGTDLNRESLRVAREARYPAWSFRTTPDDVRDRYFEPHGTGWRVNQSLRSMVRFAWLNLAADPLVPPSADFDLIACRNVTIYFDDASTQRLYRSLVDALSPGGWLLLGPSDPLPEDRSDLERVELEGAVLWRRRAAKRVPDAPVIRPVTPVAVRRPVSVPLRAPAPAPPAPTADARAELEAGLLALEAGSAGSALEWLRRATFRDPRNPLAQFGLARAYLQTGDVARAHAALIHTQRLLRPLAGDALVPGSDALLVDTLRQAVNAHLAGIEPAAA